MFINRLSLTIEYTTLPNSLHNDKNLSMKAKGILGYILSKPPNWRVYIEDIVNHCTDGTDSIRTGVQELIDKKYIYKYQKREKGKYGQYVYFCYSIPMSEEEHMADAIEMGISEIGKSDFGFSDFGKSDTIKDRKKKEMKEENNELQKDDFEKDLGNEEEVIHQTEKVEKIKVYNPHKRKPTLEEVLTYGLNNRASQELCAKFHDYYFRENDPNPLKDFHRDWRQMLGNWIVQNAKRESFANLGDSIKKVTDIVDVHKIDYTKPLSEMQYLACVDKGILTPSMVYEKDSMHIVKTTNACQLLLKSNLSKNVHKSGD